MTQPFSHPASSAIHASQGTPGPPPTGDGPSEFGDRSPRDEWPLSHRGSPRNDIAAAIIHSGGALLPHRPAGDAPGALVELVSAFTTASGDSGLSDPGAILAEAVDRALRDLGIGQELSPLFVNLLPEYAIPATSAAVLTPRDGRPVTPDLLTSMAPHFDCVLILGPARNVDEIAAALQHVAPKARNGDLPASKLTRREVQVLARLADGHTNAAIATHLAISAHTVAHHVGRILSKLGARNRAEAIRVALDAGLVR
jgi:DNA-binding CsgD family transcriptional regulator